MDRRKGCYRSPANPKTTARPPADGGRPPHQKPAGGKGVRKILDPRPHYGLTAKKPEKDDRPLRHSKTAKKHKLRQKLEQKIL